jgi:leucyl/phenylalanyl-tRNA--protein transferase
MHGQPILTPTILLRAYAEGIFPMAERRGDSDLFWVSPEMRGIIPLDAFHIPRRLARTVRSDRFKVTADMAFADVMRACAEPAPDRPESWINDEILRLYTALHAAGHAHSIECWRDGKLVGGLYGVKLGGAFFGESMFTRERDASKVALVHLVARLRRGGFSLLDTQFLTAHLVRFGTIEIPRAQYHDLLARAISHDAEF